MNPIKIFTDSTADLSKELLDKFDIVSLPLSVNFEDESYRDGVDIDTEFLYKLVEQKGVLPKTSAISPGTFFDEFEKWINKGYDVLYIGIGSKISGTFHSATVASKELPDKRVFLVDSKNLSSGIALLVLKAKDLRDQGKNASEIKTILDDIVPRVRSQFAIRVLDYLHKGGRASGTAALVGKFLRIRPIIQVRDGGMTVYKKPMGTMTKAVDIMLNDYLNEGDNLDLEYVMITHSIANKQAIYMEEFVNQKMKPKNLIISNAGCVISSHCGAGTIGILYIVKK
ncbi:DegV family protein [Haploplasma axanthum]|nr:DegV family protein [Haploplasma axanthum]